jgi:hypothetical protein
MEITGKLIRILPIQSGEDRNGVWKKQDIILELDGTPVRKLCIGLWNDKIISDLVEGSTLKVSFDIDSREYSGKWYTNLRALKVEVLSANREIENPVGRPTDEKEDYPFDEPKEIEGLPF